MTEVMTEQAGKYRQLAATLRFMRPVSGQIEQSRPRLNDADDAPFSDSEADPTTVEFSAGDQLDLAALLAVGAIVPLAAESLKPTAQPEPDGQS